MGPALATGGVLEGVDVKPARQPTEAVDPARRPKLLDLPPAVDSLSVSRFALPMVSAPTGVPSEAVRIKSEASGFPTTSDTSGSDDGIRSHVEG